MSPANGLPGLKPLPWPPPGLTRRRVRAHAHRCLACAAEFRCPGPDETTLLCAPVCPPCYWYELGVQLKVYSAVVAAMSRRREKIGRRIGPSARRRVQLMRRKLLRRRSPMAPFGQAFSNGSESTEARFAPPDQSG